MLKLIFAGVLTVTAVLLWAVFVRPVASRQAQGTVISKTLKSAGAYVQYPAGNRSGAWTPTTIPVEECTLLELAITGIEGSAVVAINDVRAREFTVGSRVVVTYEERGIGHLWRRARVVDVQCLP